LIYKVLLPSEWAEFGRQGKFDGAPFDVSSGFIHCSSRVQVGATALRVFPDEPELVVVALETEMLGDAVRWEPAPSGEMFPHVYAPLTRAAVADVYQVAGADLIDAGAADDGNDADYLGGS
jgi:uncharacterized protein (DUF952 family)